MELYDSEEQQVEAIKDWWKENGKAVILGGVIGLGGLFGWRYYQDSVIAEKDALSNSYNQAMAELAQSGSEATSQVQGFIDANKSAEYAILAALQLAKVQVEAGELDAALAQLTWAKDNTQDDALRPVISYRVARLLAQQQQYDPALSQLDALADTSWTGRVAELKGDILLAKGDTSGAYSAYSAAQQASDASQNIQVKLDDLAR